MKMTRRVSTILALGSLLIALTGCAATAHPASGVVVSAGPPPAQVEAVPVTPGPDYVWIDGSWAWDGRWLWRPGYWAVRPYPHARWERGFWRHDRSRWVWH